MQIINRDSFWFNAVVAAIPTAFVALILWWQFTGTKRTVAPDRWDHAFKQEAYQDYLNVLGLSHNDRRLIEEVLLGTRSIDDVKRIPRQRVRLQFLTAIMALKEQHGPDARKIIGDMGLVHRHREWSFSDYYYTPEGKCVAESDLSVLCDEDRLQLLLEGKPDAIHASLPMLPKAVAKPEPYPADNPIYVWSPRPRLHWMWWWSIISGIFAAAFCVTGLASEPVPRTRNSTWSHPLASHPDFVLGWLIKLAFLPGFAIAHMLYAMTVDVRPHLKTVREHLVPKPPVSESAQLEAELVAAAQRAEKEGLVALRAELDGLIVQLREAKTTAQIDGFRRKLEDIRLVMESRQEAEKI